MTANDLRAAVVAQARAWLGRREGDGSHMEIIGVYNGIRPLPRGYAMKPSDPWCAAFVSAVGASCGLKSVIYPECACDPMIAAYKAAGRIRIASYVPDPGDLVFYDWDGDGSADHVGIYALTDDKGMHVIEGNYSDEVKVRVVSHRCKQIFCYAVPDYERAAGGACPSPTEEDETPPPASHTGQNGAVLLDKPEGAVVASADSSGSGLTVNPAPDSYIDDSRVTVSLPVLRHGDTGEVVRAAQGVLIARGVSVGPDKADGDFGRNTRNGVCNFQRSRGLAVNGVIGTETWAALLGAT